MIRMSFIKLVVSVIFVSFLSLLYVHQQVELVKLSYAIDYKEKKVKDMLDRREELSYNIKNLEAPARLERVLLSKKVDIAFPKRTNVFRVAKLSATARAEENLRASIFEKVNLFGIFDFFSAKAEAHTKEK